MILIYTDCKNRKEAKKIAGLLLKLRLVACANWWPVESLYRWEGKVVNNKEIFLVLKTRKMYCQKVESIIKKLHSYDVPLICRIDINKVDKRYKEWLMKETRIV